MQLSRRYRNDPGDKICAKLPLSSVMSRHVDEKHDMLNMKLPNMLTTSIAVQEVIGSTHFDKNKEAPQSQASFRSSA
jgi:hypothetical protein